MISRSCPLLVLFIALLSISSVECSAFLTSQETDKVALLALRDGLIGGGTPSNGSALSSWNTSLDICQWKGVRCGKKHKRVTMIILEEQKLRGVVSPFIGNLTFLRGIYLSNNSLHGKIPEEIGHLHRLRYLYLRSNSFEGQIPAKLSNCSSLQEINFSRNKLTGRIPVQLGALSNLNLFYVPRNSLVGEMPSFLRNLSSLAELFLGYNYFDGEIQDSLNGLSKLTTLSLRSTNLYGSISPLYNLSSLSVLDLSTNKFTGTLPEDMDVVFPNLTFLSLSDNSFEGTIPSSLSNISGLSVIQLDSNKLTGRVPYNLGKLKYLTNLQLAVNNLGSVKSNDLSFIDSLTNCTQLEWLILDDNRFGGTLPNSIVNLSSSLQLLGASENYIKGPVPEDIGKLSGLSWIEFGRNLLTGTIPDSIGNLGNVSRLSLYDNKLHGEIPSSLGRLTNLYELILAKNSLNGTIPASLGNCKKLQRVDISSNYFYGNLPGDVFNHFQELTSCDLSYNSFDGTFPSGFGKLINLNSLNASHNRFSGEIPTQLGGSLGMEFLLMAGNSFEGSIPSSLSNLKSLIWLDLSNNDLSGLIPMDLAFIVGLKKLNLSFNRLEGEVPSFVNLTEVSVVGNNRLCSRNLKLEVQLCKHHKNWSNMVSRKVIIVIILSVIGFLSVNVFLCMFFGCRRKLKNDNIEGLAKGCQLVAYKELFKATDGFAESNLIGTGGFGNVYKGCLDGDERKLIAVKVLNLSKHGATKSFTVECKVLRGIRHKNILKLQTVCSSLDHKGNEFKALVFDFMSNGNLDSWVHIDDKQQQGAREPLTLGKRLEIAIDVGCALDYLHNHCEEPIVHGDLKPSNILLDDDMVAHVGDFGLAKLLHGVTENISRGESLSIAIKGSIGYVAPEYGMGATIAPHGDIYSYGILLLELFTRIRPTDEMFNSEMSFRSFIERAMPDQVEDIIDKSLTNRIREDVASQGNADGIILQYHNFLVSIVEIGISCSKESARDRMDIQSAIRCLQRIRENCDAVNKVRSII